MKAKNINIILLIILILICIMLLYGLFNNKHHEVYNEMNKIILKEKFNADSNCMNVETECGDVSLQCGREEEEGCINTRKWQEYCDYLVEINKVLKSSCFSCDEKNNIINTAKRVKCLSLAATIDAAASSMTGASDATSSPG